MSWGKQSFNYIISKFNELSKADPSLSIDEILSKINKEHYPFGVRANHPYKQWLKAMKAAKDFIGLMRGNQRVIAEAKASEKDGKQRVLEGMEGA